MSFQISSDNISLSDSMKDMARTKLDIIEQRLSDVPDDIKLIRVVLNKAPLDKFEVKIEVTAEGNKYFATDIDFALETALIHAVTEIEKQMDKTQTAKEKGWEKKRKLKIVPEDLPDE